MKNKKIQKQLNFKRIKWFRGIHRGNKKIREKNSDTCAKKDKHNKECESKK